MRLLPPSNVPPQVLSIVVDLGPGSSGRAAREGQLPRTVEQLSRMFQGFRVAVTWAVDETVENPLVDQIITGDGHHDIALRAGTEWAGPEAGRGIFSTGLSRRVQQAEQAGFEITAIVANQPIRDENLDLLIKYGIDLVVNSAQVKSVARSLRTLRYGLWEISPAVSLPEEQQGWTPFGGARRRTRAVIDQAIEDETLCPVAIDASRFDERSCQAAVDKMLRHTHRRNRQGVLGVQTLQAVASELRDVRTSRGSVSILRAA